MGKKLKKFIRGVAKTIAKRKIKKEMKLKKKELGRQLTLEEKKDIVDRNVNDVMKKGIIGALVGAGIIAVSGPVLGLTNGEEIEEEMDGTQIEESTEEEVEDTIEESVEQHYNENENEEIIVKIEDEDSIEFCIYKNKFDDIKRYAQNSFIEEYEEQYGETEWVTDQITFRKKGQDYYWLVDRNGEKVVVTHGSYPDITKSKLQNDGINAEDPNNIIYGNDVYYVMANGNIVAGYAPGEYDPTTKTMPVYPVIHGDHYGEKGYMEKLIDEDVADIIMDIADYQKSEEPRYLEYAWGRMNARENAREESQEVKPEISTDKDDDYELEP